MNARNEAVSVLAYFRKEGRSLGEVTKFRVYNAHKHCAIEFSSPNSGGGYSWFV